MSDNPYMYEEETTIEHRGKQHTFRIREFTEPEMKKVFPLDKEGKPDKSKQDGYANRAICIGAKTKEGGEIDHEHAESMPIVLKMELVRRIVDLNKIETVDEDGQEKSLGEG